MNTIFYIACVCLSLFLASPVGLAQEFPAQHYSIDQGLPSKIIYAVYKDRKGFMWFATDKGVTRYNGMRFENFSTFNGLPDNEIFFFKEDLSGRLWLGTYNGSLCYYKDGIFHTAQNTPFLRMSIALPHTYNITVEYDSSVTFNFYDHYYMLNVAGETKQLFNFRRVAQERDPVDFARYSVAYQRKTGPDLFKVISKIGISYTDSMNTIKKVINADRGFHLQYIPSQDTGYIKNERCVLSQDLDTICALKNGEQLTKRIYSYFKDERNTFLGLNDGVIINDSFWLFRNRSVSSVSSDNWGNYWIATLNDGVYFLASKFLDTWRYNDQYKTGIKSCLATNGHILFATYDNDDYSLEKGVLTRLVDFSKYRDLSFYKFSRDGGHLFDLEHNSITFFDKYNIFVNDLKKRTTTVLSALQDDYGTKEIFLAAHKAYIRTRVALDYYDYPISWRDSAKHRKSIYMPDHSQRTFAVSQAKDSSLWFATLSGVYHVVNDTAVQQSHFRNISFKSFVFLDTFIIGCTHTNNLLILNSTNPGFIVDTVGMQNCVFDKFYVLDSCHVLVSTNNLYRLLTVLPGATSVTYSIAAIDDPTLPRDPDDVCCDAKCCYFFKNGAITAINTRYLLQVCEPPVIFFKGIVTNAENYLSSGSRIEIDYDEANNIRVLLSRIVWNGREMSQQYSISKDAGEVWRDFEGENVSLLNPGYGDYIIKVRAKTVSSGYSEPAILYLTILRPYWATWWFVLSLGGLLVLLAVFVVRYRIRYAVRKNEKAHENEMKFVKSEYKALNALMNPHFVFNTLNNVQGLVNRDDKLAANEYIRVFADLIRQNMHNLSQEVITLQKELELVVNYLLLEKLRFKELLNYAVEVDDKLDLSEIFVPPLLVQPLVENSVKHGILPLESRDAMVVIRIYERGASLFIEVRDNGVGISRSGEKRDGDTHESFAMGNIKKRIDQLAIILNKRITLDMQEQIQSGTKRRWTVVTISMPIF